MQYHNVAISQYCHFWKQVSKKVFARVFAVLFITIYNVNIQHLLKDFAETLNENFYIS